jgi:hypothetical protein
MLRLLKAYTLTLLLLLAWLTPNVEDSVSTWIGSGLRDPFRANGTDPGSKTRRYEDGVGATSNH